MKKRREKKKKGGGRFLDSRKWKEYRMRVVATFLGRYFQSAVVLGEKKRFKDSLLIVGPE